MKARVKVSYSVELNVEGKDEAEIYDYVSRKTPTEVYNDALNDNGWSWACESYEDEILDYLGDDATVDYKIEW